MDRCRDAPVTATPYAAFPMGPGFSLNGVLDYGLALAPVAGIPREAGPSLVDSGHALRNRLLLRNDRQSKVRVWRKRLS